MRFSIITVTYNSKRFLRRTIESVLSQSFEDFEYLFVDGGSTDGTLDIIRECASDPRVRWISEPDRGIADAMNKGIALSKGEYVACIHSDDFYHDEKVLSLVDAALSGKEGSVWATGGMAIVDEEDRELQTIAVRDYSYAELLAGNTILHPSTFVRRSALAEAGGFDISLKYAMDYDLWLRLGKIGAPVRVDHPLACFRAHRSSLSTKEARNATDEEWKVRRRYLSAHPFAYLKHYYRYLRTKNVNADFFRKLVDLD